MSSHGIKAPPALSKSTSHKTWLKELEIWQAFTDLPVEKQGPAIFLTLERKACEAALELEVKNISGKEGVAKGYYYKTRYSLQERQISSCI